MSPVPSVLGGRATAGTDVPGLAVRARQSILGGMTDDMASRTSKPRKNPRKKPEITRWKRMLLIGAMAFVALGIGLRVAGRADEGATSETSTAPANGPATPGATVPGAGGEPSGSTGLEGAANSLVEDGQSLTGKSPAAQSPAPASEEDSGWSPFFLRNGFSFLVAFAIGFAARVWLKITMMVLGTILIGVFALSYFGVLEVDWSTMGKVWDGIAGRIGEEMKDFKGFVTGSLPQTGMGTLGLIAGFKMR